jgi:DNA excision repair protein ERCC-2
LYNSIAASGAPPENEIVAAPSKALHSVSVRDLVEFVWQQGDLGGERDFVGSQRALEGTRGHQKLQRSRPPGYEAEVRVRHEVEREQFLLRIHGRIDGVHAENGAVQIEEIKTVHGRWDGTADPIHWAQAKAYAAIYSLSTNAPGITIVLTYLELASGKATGLTQYFDTPSLTRFLEETISAYCQWLEEQRCWQETRDQAIAALQFPFALYRPGQRELAVAVFKAIAGEKRLYVAAPTGIGKTISTLFPAIKALGERKLERIFYLTARTPGRLVAQKALDDLRRAGLRLRSLTLTAKEKICAREGQSCDPTTCPLAIGYYDRIKDAMRAALQRETLTRTDIEQFAAKHQVCPFELSLDVSSWVDVVICDYNYAFDPKVYLRRHFEDGTGENTFLVDEAHNLVDRAREMFSAELDAASLQKVRRAIQKSVPRCARALSKVISAMRKAAAGEKPDSGPAATDESPSEPDLFSTTAPAARATDARTPPAREAAVCLKELPQELLHVAQQALDAAEAWLARNEPADFRQELLELYFQLHAFLKTADLYDERYVTIIDGGRFVRVRLFCLDPSFLLREALERGKSAIFFSATLTPIDYYRNLLGGEDSDRALELLSPFPPENLCILVHARIRTDYRSRADSLDEVVESIAAFVRAHTGNYLVYLPSFQYLAAVHERFRLSHPTIETQAQRAAMDEAERDAFLGAFASERPETLLGFAVMGGIFGEGIDLIGERLIGAVIVGVGLPQLSVERDLMRDHFQERLGEGFNYAYTFPGINRVLQAVGRVIRSESDRGAVLLIDSRFGEQRYRRLFPPHWRPRFVKTAGEVESLSTRFWNEMGSPEGP